MVKMLTLMLLSLIAGANCHNLELNNLIPIDIDISKHLPEPVKYRYLHSLRCNLYEINPDDRSRLRIGNVFEYGVMVYPDSPILVSRKVYKLVNDSQSFSVIQVNSTYRKSGVEQKEITELIRYPNESFFREIVRKCFHLNLRPGHVNRPEILVLYDVGTRVTTYSIRSEDRLRYKIGTVRYGEVLIDGYQNTVTSKMVETRLDEAARLVVEVTKMLKTGEHVHTKCVMVFKEPPERSFCKELEVNIKNILG